MLARSKTLAVCCWLMIPVITCSSMPAETAGMLSGRGTVTVDEQPWTGRNAVFPGSKIQTRERSQAVVTRPGLVVSIAENSSLVLGKSGLELQSGVVVISSTGGITAQVDEATIKTARGTASRFIAKRMGDDLLVAALEGEVFVAQDQEGGAIPPNKGVHVKLKKKKGGTDPNEKRIGWLHNDDLGLLLVLAAGVVAGVAIGLANSGGSTAATPVGP